MPNPPHYLQVRFEDLLGRLRAWGVALYFSPVPGGYSLLAGDVPRYPQSGVEGLVQAAGVVHPEAVPS